MVSSVRAVGVAIECLGSVALLALSRAVDGEVRARPLGVGFAAGYCYRHARAAGDCRRFRDRPGRTLGVALAWTALGVALDRSIDDPAANRAFAAGLGLGSAGYWLVRRGE
ncbi:hypothetical protein EXE46_13155 [Halorubrum sp. GN11_10-6_MGM]|uniref:hypothetical protein n=1 Tax=Halorubrum sp. GN11_10-6_MGM TaxID=2518112 RepID=UPI0010F47D24|nr:hypothetical protein [Halorubrum sp. GN11_10-6_MGM]TKX73664.1 hypothetical protein EXE46_13155 [Halorubrum sp. GN11_10-6_MGM]